MKSKRWFAVPAIVTLTAGSAALMGAGLPAAAQTALPAAVFSGYSTGTVVHTGLLDLGVVGPRVANTDEAFSGATVASQGTNTVTQGAPGSTAGRVINEMSREVQEVLPDAASNKTQGDRSYGRGAGLEVDLAGGLPGVAPTIPLNTVKVSSPPKSDAKLEVGPVNGDPVAFASLLRGEAHSDWNNSTCILGKPISQGIGFAADAELVNSAGGGALGAPNSRPVVSTNGNTPARSVAQSLSQTVLTGQTDRADKPLGSALGLGSETRQTIAPVTLFAGTPQEITIEIAGEWVLQAVAGGVPGSAFVRYAPPSQPDPTTPLIRVVQPPAIAGGVPVITNILTTQTVLGPNGLTVPIPGIADITVGEKARAIGGATGTAPQEAADGTVASGAVDVVRVRILTNPVGLNVGDIRIGHMEARAQVPIGGIRCPIPVDKSPDRVQVSAGERFTYTVTVNNPFDCTLDPVRVTDTITPGTIRYSIIGTNPASNTTGNQVVFDNIGPIAPHTSKSVTIDVQVAANSPSGTFTNEAVADATCATGSGQGLARVSVPLNGRVVIVLPKVGAVAGELAATGGRSWWLPFGALAIAVGAAGFVGVRRRPGSSTA